MLMVAIPLLRTWTIWLVTGVTVEPRAMTIMAVFPPWSTLRRTRRIRPLAPQLNVLAGLLYSRTPGPPVIVWVTVICRRLLLESRVGKPLI